MDKKLTNYNPELVIIAFPSVDDEIDNSLPIMNRKLVKRLSIVKRRKTMKKSLNDLIENSYEIGPDVDKESEAVGALSI